MLRTCFSFLFLLTLAWPASLWSAEYNPEARAAKIAPFIDDQTIGIGYLNLERIDLAATASMLKKALPILVEAPDEETQKSQDKLQAWLDDLKKAGCQEVFAIFSLTDIPGRMPLFVIGTSADADVLALQKLILGGPERATTSPPNVSLVKLHGQIVLAETATIERMKELTPKPRPQVLAAFKAAGDTTAQALLIPSDDSRRVVSEMIGALPKDFGDVSGKDLAAALQYAVAGVDLPPKLEVRLTIQSQDEASAKKLLGVIDSGLNLASKFPQVKELVAKFDELKKVVLPKQNGDRLVLDLNESNGGAKVALALLTPPLEAAREAAQRLQSINNLKQFALAMHNYHDTYRHLPAAASSKDGKQLLSWRVHILPFIEQVPLYNQFKLDEPWDSEHNKTLIAKMPKIFENPGFKLEAGTTAYLVPPDKEAFFAAEEGNTFSKITDGLSNTIMIVEANPDQAVVWTKPSDLVIHWDKPIQGLDRARKDGFLTAFGDGSVRFIKNTVAPITLKALFTRAGGEVVADY